MGGASGWFSFDEQNAPAVSVHKQNFIDLNFYFNSERIPNKVLDSRQRSQLYIALKNANSTILKFLHSLSVSEIPLDSNDPKTKVFYIIEVSA